VPAAERLRRHGRAARARPPTLARAAAAACLLALVPVGESAKRLPRASVPRPTPIGVTGAYRLPATSPAVAAGRPVGSLRCTRSRARRDGVHVELFARRLVLLLPAGIGIAPPLRRDGAYVLGGRCSYPLLTREPSGVVEVAAGRRLTVGQLFSVWGQPLSRRVLAGFRAPRGKEVLAFVGGRRWTDDPRRIPLSRHAEIVLEIGGYVPPHRSYLFHQGL